MAGATFVLVHPALDRALLEANALPSRLAHPAWLEAWARAGAGLWQRLVEALSHLDPDTPVLHRHVSAALLQDPVLDLGWIQGMDDPALPLALAPPPLFASLQHRAGLVLLGPAIRQVIARSELALLEEALGSQALAFVRQQAPRLWRGGTPPIRVRAHEVEGQVHQWGAALIGRALGAASPPVAHRGLMRLPPDEPVTITLPETLSAHPQALALARALLYELDASWLSHFPVMR